MKREFLVEDKHHTNIAFSVFNGIYFRVKILMNGVFYDLKYYQFLILKTLIRYNQLRFKETPYVFYLFYCLTGGFPPFLGMS